MKTRNVIIALAFALLAGSASAQITTSPPISANALGGLGSANAVYNVKDNRFGAKGDALGETQGLTDGAITTGTAAFTSNNATFASTDCTGGSGCTGTVNKVIRIKAGNTVTISNASPAVVTWTNHGLAAGTPIYFYTSGGLPTGITSGVTYYVIAAGLGANSFQISTTSGGTALNTSSAGSGTHTANASALLDTTITSFVNSHSVGLAANAAGTYNSARFSYGTNDTTAIQAAITAAQASITAGANVGCVHLPAVTFGYIITSEIAITSGVCLTGDIGMAPFGTTGSTLLPGKSIRAINVTNVLTPVILRDFAIWYPFNADANVAAILIDSASSIYYPLIKDVMIINPNIGVNVKNGLNVTIDNLQVYYYNNVGIKVESVNSPDGGGTNLTNSSFSPVLTSTYTATCILWKSGGASRFINNNCPAVSVGFSVAMQAGATTGELQVIGNIFDSGTTCIQMTRDANTAQFISAIFNGNQCNLMTVGLSVPTDATGAWITNLMFNDNAYRGANSASAKAVSVDSTTNFIASGNLLASANASTVAYTIGSAVTTCGIGPGKKNGTFAADSFGVSCASNLVGTAANDNAPAGSVGEYISSELLAASEITLTTGNTTTVTSIALTAGDWDVDGNITFDGSGTTTVSAAGAFITTSGAFFPTTYFQGGSNFLSGFTITAGAGVVTLPTSLVRVSVSGNQTVYLVSYAAFGVSTLKAYGGIRARRVR